MMRSPFALAVASAFLAGEWSIPSMVARATESLGLAAQHRPSLLALARRALTRFPSPPHDARDSLASELAALPSFRRLRSASDHIQRFLIDEPAMGRTPWPVPPLASEGELATLLAVSVDELAFLADRRALERHGPAERLRSYRYRWIEKPSGGVRLIEAPKPRLATLQRKVLHEILDRIPPHEAAHAFRAGRSIASFAAPHAGRAIVVRVDLEDFFASIRGPRVVAIFRRAGYPEQVARTLAALCTNRAPRDVLEHARPRHAEEVDRLFRMRRRLADFHLPQGAPTSPALANLGSFRLDVRLAGLATAASASFGRYADDLAFSGDEAFARHADVFCVRVASIALQEGFLVAFRKTRVMRRGVRQHLAGLVVNDRPTIPRDEYDRLRALLHNCARHGAATQNRDGHPDFEAHVRGRVAHVAMVDPRRGQRLREMLERMAW